MTRLQALRAAFDLELNVLPGGKRTESGGIVAEKCTNTSSEPFAGAMKP